MAGPYFWVGGSGNWSDATNHWATVSGGAPNAANVPTSADNVIFDALSNATAYTVTQDQGGAACKDMTWALPGTSGVPTFAGGTGLNIAGSLTKVATMVWTFNGGLTFSSNTAGKTITSAGVGYAQSITFSGSGSWTLQDALTNAAANTITVSAGTLITGAFTHSTGFFVSTSGTRTLTLDNSTINITGTSGTPFSLNSAGLTLSTTGSTVNINGGANGVTINVSPGNGPSDWNTINITAIGTVQLNNNVNVKNLSYTSSTNKTDKLVMSSGTWTIKASGSLTIAGNSVVNRAFFTSDTLGTQRTITVPNTATLSLTNVDFQDIASAGTFGTWTGTSLGDALGNSGITFDASVALTWDTSKTGAQNWSGSNWLGTTNRVPLPQDDVTLPAIGSATTITMDMPRIGRNNDWSAFNRTLAAGSAYTLFGNLTLGASNTLPALTTTFGGRGAQTITSNGKSFGGSIIVNAFGGSYTLQDALSTGSGITLNNGTIADGGFNLSALSLSSSGSATRAVSGSGIWSLSGTSGSMWNASGSAFTTTGLIGTIKFTGNVTTTITFAGNGLAYPNFWWSNTAATGTIIITGANNAFNDFKVDGTTARTVQFPASTTQTVSSFTVSGADASHKISLTSSSPGTKATLSKASGIVANDNLNIQDSEALGGAQWFAGSHSTDSGGNSGWLFRDAGSDWLIRARRRGRR